LILDVDLAFADDVVVAIDECTAANAGAARFRF
jgi:hypothetical protein